MSRKPEFDPSLHMIKNSEKKKTNNDKKRQSLDKKDEALARQLQLKFLEQKLEADRRAEESDKNLALLIQSEEGINGTSSSLSDIAGRSASHHGVVPSKPDVGQPKIMSRGMSQEDEDAALAQAMQVMETESASTTGRNESQTSRKKDNVDLDLELAHQLQTEDSHSEFARQFQAQDPDLELARQLQDQEDIIGNTILENNGSSPKGFVHDSNSSLLRMEEDRLNQLEQERKDELLARQFSSLHEHEADHTNKSNNNNLANMQSTKHGRARRPHPHQPTTVPLPNRPLLANILPSQPDNSAQSPKTNRRNKTAVGSIPAGDDESNPVPSLDAPQAASFSPSTAPTDRTKKKKLGLFGILGKRGNSHGNNANSNNNTQNTENTTALPGPLPHSLSINDIAISIASQPEIIVQQNKRKGEEQMPKTTPSSNLPRCSVCNEIAYSYLQTLGNKYHPECFKCLGCHERIDPNEVFTFYTGEDGEKYPLHRNCYAELYGIKCAVCNESIPTDPNGKVSFIKHPFFESEQMCPKHARDSGRRCTGCHRFEPIGNGFADLGDANRCVCHACCRTVIVDSEDAKPLWKNVINFFQNGLNLPIWAEMSEIPVLVVGYDALNDHLANTAHSGSSQIMTRGLCLSEHHGRRFALPRMKFDSESRSFKSIDVKSNGYTYFQIPDEGKVNPDSSVTAILCLSGLPSDLTASVLAHEATHAWFKLHPNYDINRPLPMQVEEGCCQLIAMLFLIDGLEREASNETFDQSGPSDEKLRQYFKYSIEADEHEIYGKGYRLAAKAYASIGIEALLSHIVMYGEFPIVD